MYKKGTFFERQQSILIKRKFLAWWKNFFQENLVKNTKCFSPNYERENLYCKVKINKKKIFTNNRDVQPFSTKDNLGLPYQRYSQAK